MDNSAGYYTVAGWCVRLATARESPVQIPVLAMFQNQSSLGDGALMLTQLWCCVLSSNCIVKNDYVTWPVHCGFIMVQWDVRNENGNDYK